MTSPFKRMVANDIRSVFINAMEFAETRLLNGKPVRCVLDEYTHKAREVKLTARVEGVNVDRATLFVEVKDLPEKPRNGQLFMVDRRRFTVDTVSEDMGVYEILLEGFNQ